ncbi:hypothetical protein SVAN01_08450 [Stagonosporopsis vannaccii]|nr:hypothetical protein SVAN01_08450 [Stagonosporopsis vannaccii]
MLVLGCVCNVTKRQLMPPPCLPRHLRPCRPLWSARQVRSASDTPSSRRSTAGGDAAKSARPRGTARHSASPSQAQRTRMLLGGPNASSTSPGPRIRGLPSADALPEPRIRKFPVSHASNRLQGAMATYMAKRDELHEAQHSVQKAQQSRTSTKTEDELRERVKALEGQLSRLLQRLQASNAPSTEQPQPLQTKGPVDKAGAAVEAAPRESTPPETPDASTDNSRNAGPRATRNREQSRGASSNTKPPANADRSDSARTEPQATQTRDGEDGTPPPTKHMVDVGQAFVVKAASQPAESRGQVNSTPPSTQHAAVTGPSDSAGAAGESTQTPKFDTPKSDTTTLAQQIQAQSKSMKSSSHPQSSRPAPRAPSTASDEVSEQSLLDELFPEASGHVQPDASEKRPSPPKLDLPAPETDPRIRLAPYDGRTGREKAIDAFRARGEQTTVLQLSNCSTALTESDFRRLIPRGLHIGTWSRDGDFFKIIPGRDPLSLARLPIYYLLFRSSASALAYQKNASRLSKLTALHSPNSIHSAIMPPAGFLEDGEDIHAVTSSFVLHPHGHQLDLRTVMQPYNRALRALIDAGGYTPIVPNMDENGNKIHRVLLHIDGYEPSHWDLWQIISRHAHSRGILWPFRNEHAGALRRLRDCINLRTISKTKFQAVSTSSPRAAGSLNDRSRSEAGGFDYEDPQIAMFLGTSSDSSDAETQTSQETNQLVMNRVYNRWIVELDDEDAARRFAGLWHRVVLPDAKDRKGAWKEAEEERWVQAEYLW